MKDGKHINHQTLSLQKKQQVFVSKTFPVCPSDNKSWLGVKDRNLCKMVDVSTSRSKEKAYIYYQLDISCSAEKREEQ